jgi:hypothetical protein
MEGEYGGGGLDKLAEDEGGGGLEQQENGVEEEVGVEGL